MSLEWGLHVFVTDKQVSKTIRVSGEMIIGEVILELVSALTGKSHIRFVLVTERPALAIPRS